MKVQELIEFLQQLNPSADINALASPGVPAKIAIQKNGPSYEIGPAFAERKPSRQKRTGMTLRRQNGESVSLAMHGDEIARITLVSSHTGQAKIRFNARADVVIARDEVMENYTTPTQGQNTEPLK